ncbi:MAG: glycosyltransferase [Lachnospiraceae bacterium]|jgi:glycosyltransferase involved in cell wall biosynthesis|nr:glycosyltransferase [Lachnospiraceae bacterium]GFI17388.1 putative glycosyltransferase EpsJ [Lachnospiraceae bacterium]
MISIIVPIYNVEKYIGNCLRSILAQTCEDMEIICIDDGSVDSSGDILDKFAKEDKRIKVIHKQNGGLISARKEGLLAASSDYIGWVDGDDWIEPCYFENLLSEQKKSGADIVTASLYSDLGKKSSRMMGCLGKGVYSRQEVIASMLYGGEFFCQGLPPHMVTKLIRKDILHKSLFMTDDRISYGEDAAIFYGCVLEADLIQVTDICGYHYVQRAGSIAHISYLDEQHRFHALISHLEKIFKAYGVYSAMQPQMEAYKRYYAALRMISLWDTSSSLLFPYGGIPAGSSVAIYGAGVMGQQLYHYLQSLRSIEVIAWLDQNYTYFQKIGLTVSKPDDISKIQKYDYVLIAVTSMKASEDIRKYLLGLNVPYDKIRWLSEDYLDMSRVLDFSQKDNGETF